MGSVLSLKARCRGGDGRFQHLRELSAYAFQDGLLEVRQGGVGVALSEDGESRSQGHQRCYNRSGRGGRHNDCPFQRGRWDLVSPASFFLRPYRMSRQIPTIVHALPLLFLRCTTSGHTHPARRLLGFACHGNLYDYIGFEIVEQRHAVIHDIAVEPDARGHGIGRLMVEWIITSEDIGKVSAETDGEAVGFYQRCGFGTAKFEHPLYPGVERFRCELVVEPKC